MPSFTAVFYQPLQPSVRLSRFAAQLAEVCVGSYKIDMRIFLTIFFAYSLISCSGGGHDRESGVNKQEWSILQVAEYQWRSKPITSPEFHLVVGHELMSVPSLSGSKRIWIILRAESSPFYKQMPKGNYKISESLIHELASSGRVTPTVEEVLRSHIIE